MSIGLKKNLSVDDLIDLAIILTACLGILVILFLLVAFSLNNPEEATSFLGNFDPEKGAAGIGGVLLFLFLIIRLVLKRRKKHGR